MLGGGIPGGPDGPHTAPALVGESNIAPRGQIFVPQQRKVARDSKYDGTNGVIFLAFKNDDPFVWRIDNIVASSDGAVPVRVAVYLVDSYSEGSEISYDHLVDWLTIPTAGTGSSSRHQELYVMPNQWLAFVFSGTAGSMAHSYATAYLTGGTFAQVPYGGAGKL